MSDRMREGEAPEQRRQPASTRPDDGGYALPAQAGAVPALIARVRDGGTTGAGPTLAGALRTLQHGAGNAAVQRAAGNAAVQRAADSSAPGLQREGPPASTITFDQPEVVTGSVTRIAAGDTPAAVTGTINQIVGTYQAHRADLGTSWMGAIEQFETFMKFPADAEAEAQYLNTALKFAGKKVLEHLVKGALEPLKALGPPGFGAAVDSTFGFVEAMVAEYERAQTAAGQIKVRDAIADLRRLADRDLRGLSASIVNLPQLLEQGYREAVAAGDRPTGSGTAASPNAAGANPASARTPGAITPGTTTLTGPGAEFILGARRVADRLVATQPSLEDLFQGILSRWTMSREGAVESLGGGDVYLGGRIYLTLRVHKDGDNYRIASAPTKGRLAAPEAAKTASALTNSLAGSNRTINDLPILKVMRVEIEDEVWGFNDTYRTGVTWRSPGQIESTGPHLGPRVDTEYLEKAAVYGPRALELVDLSALRINQLDPYG